MEPLQIIGKRVGILGGGQLAQMLVEAAHRLGLRPKVFAGSATDPAALLCPETFVGDSRDPGALREFFSQVELVIFENEFISCELVKRASKGLSLSFAPSLDTLFELQDKIRQKRILDRLSIPTAPYEIHANAEGAEDWVRRMLARFRGECVLKWAQLGYDGKGTWIAGVSGDEASAVDFCKQALSRKIPLLAEAKIRFKRELALVASFSTTGEVAPYPLVETRQKSGICHWVKGPATALGVDPALEEKAHSFAAAIARDLELHGTFAIEMFETEQGEIWVNELAPRVHNSGHYTQDASATSQFENHWRGVLGMRLGSTRSAPGFAMLNLLGTAESTEPASLAVELDRRTHLHWYGKTELRPGRKLGHLNGRAESPDEIDELMEELQKFERCWARSRKSDERK